MKDDPLNEQDRLFADLKEIQASMKIEGFELSDAELAEVAKRCRENSFVQRLPELAKKAKREGRDLADVVNDALKLNLDFESEDEDA